VLLAESSAAASAKICDTLSGHGHKTTVATSAAEALTISKQNRFDLIILSLKVGNDDGLRLVSQMRSQDETRQVPILLVVDEFDTPRLIKGLDIGASDYLVKPIDRNELIARSCAPRSAGAVIRTACAPTTSAACRWRSPIR
jgi:two-component system cell cycle response regulator